MGQSKTTLSSGNNEIATAHSHESTIVVQSDTAVTIAFGEAATANSFPILANLPYSFTGRRFSGTNVNIFGSGGEEVWILW